jgi:hypothetical protein
MIVEYSEPSSNVEGTEIRYGVPSWAPNGSTEKSVKFTWFTTKGHAARGGEVPAQVIGQMYLVTIRMGETNRAGVLSILETALRHNVVTMADVLIMLASYTRSN